MDIRLHQIYYRDDQRDRLEPGFIPFDNRANPRPALCEWHVFEKLTQGEAAPEKLTGGALFGAVSWKFQEKTGLRGEEFLQFIRSAPPADVYFISPFTEDRALWPSPWVQGEARHPGLLPLAEQAFKAVGHDRALLHDWMPLPLAAYCNYFVGNRTFWERYLAFVTPVAHWMVEAGVLSGADPRAHRGFFPFVLERLFSTFLLQARDLRVASYPVTEAWLRRTEGRLAAPLMEVCRFRDSLETVSLTHRAKILEPVRELYFEHREATKRLRSLEGSVHRYQKWLAPLRPLGQLVRRLT